MCSLRLPLCWLLWPLCLCCVCCQKSVEGVRLHTHTHTHLRMCAPAYCVLTLLYIFADCCNKLVQRIFFVRFSHTGGNFTSSNLSNFLKFQNKKAKKQKKNPTVKGNNRNHLTKRRLALFSTLLNVFQMKHDKLPAATDKLSGRPSCIDLIFGNFAQMAILPTNKAHAMSTIVKRNRSKSN